MIFKKTSTNTRKKLYYTFKITEQEYLKLRSFLKENKIPYKKRIKLDFRVSKSIILALSLLIILVVSVIIFIKVVN